MSADGVALRMPKLGMEMTEGTLTSWLVADGAVVEKGQSLYVVETEKVENEVPSPAAGVVHRQADEGGTYPVGETLGEIVPVDPAG